MNMGLTGIAAALLAAAALGISGCASQKEPAEQALAGIEETFGQSGAEIQKYLPERHAELSASIAGLREAMANEDYGDVVAGAGAVRESLKRAIAESRIRRARMRAEMEDDWVKLTETMPAMIEAMDKKVAAHRRRPPEGMTREAWKATIDSYDAARDAWTKAAAEMSAPTFEASVLAARDARQKIAGIMETLGLEVEDS